MGNIASLIKAIPSNIPTKATLKTLEIVNVAFYDDYAKIEFDKDFSAEALAEKGIQYRGQF